MLKKIILLNLLIGIFFIKDATSSNESESDVEIEDHKYLPIPIFLNKDATSDEKKEDQEISSNIFKYLPITNLSNIVSNYLDNYVLFSNSNDSTSKLRKYLYNGNLDLSFGNKGIADCPCREIVSMTRDYVNGKVFVVGRFDDQKACLAAFTRNGELDKNFAEGKGYILIDVDNNSPYITHGPNSIKIALDKDQKILYLNGFSRFRDLFRYNRDGSLDTKINISDYSKDMSVIFSSIIYSTDDKIIIGTGLGAKQNPYYRGKILSYILRLDNNGKFDKDFGMNGFSLEPYGKTILAIYEQNNENILTANFSGTNGYISKYDLHGSVDNGFGNEKNGHVKLNDIIPSILEVDDEGKILTAGLRIEPKTATLKIVRLLEDGKLDKTFANDGIFEKHFIHSPLMPNLPSGLILLRALFGKITIGGFIKDKNFLFRLNNDGTEDNAFKGVKP